MERSGRRNDAPSPTDPPPLQRIKAFLRLVEAAEGPGVVPKESLPAEAASRLLGAAFDRKPPPGREGEAAP